ncbi:acetyl-CoA C-acyltransferase [Stackebrandtia albiflava]|uniref:acetyl-CoA C-acyltransferase n=1 Tax=Stackebrandtia albiflava TaxID=406432 RepID=UPI0011BF6F2A
MRDAVIVAAVRTPIGRGRPTGALHHVHPVDLLAHVLREVVDRAGVDPSQIDDVITGAVSQVGEQGANIARRAVLAAGFPETVPATTVDRQCGSGQQAIHFAAQGVASGAYDMVIASGVESMSRVPMWSALTGTDDPFGTGFARRYPEGLVPQGIAAELINARWNLGRTALDEFALASHERAAHTAATGGFDAETAPLPGLAHDEGVRTGSDLDILSRLPAAYHDEAMGRRFPQIRWDVTAANTSQLSDGAAAVLITDGDTARRLGLTPLARLHSFAVTGDDPLYMLTAIIPATARVLRRAGLRIDDIDLFEVNEAFASVVLAWQRETGADPVRVNVHGGAIALGHPLGASGARLMTTLVHALAARGGRYGMQLMCEAGGMANATIVERW